MSIAPRTSIVGFIIYLILILLLPLGNLSWLFLSSDGGSSGSSSATEVVREDGFTLELDGITIRAGGDVAPEGTEVRAELTTPEIPQSIESFANPVGTGVEITLGNNLQPSDNLTITFAPSEVSQWYNATEGDSDLLPVVFASSDNEYGVELADAHLLSDGSVVVNTEHLSEFYPGVTRVSNFSNWMVGEVAVFMGARSDEPSCRNHQNESDWAVLGVIDQTFWPCVHETSSGVNLTLTSNNPSVWLVSSSQASVYDSSTSGLAGIPSYYVALLNSDYSNQAPIMPPNGSAIFTSTMTEGEILFEAELNYGLTSFNAVVNTAVALLPPSKAKIVFDTLGRADCASNLFDEAAGGVRPDGSFVRTALECVSTFVDGLGGDLLSSVTAVPGATIAMADATYRSLAGTDQFTFTLSKVSADSGSWPTDRNDRGGALYTWLGANFYGFPDWVACDDAQDWCLIGYDGERHLLVKIDGLKAMYWIDDNVASPKDALLSTGLPENVVSEILGE